MTADQLEVRNEPITSTVAVQMIAALNAELSARYPEEGANHFRLDPEEVVEGRGAFLVAYVHGRPSGCGAVRRLGRETAEIKRMYVDPRARGQGVGYALLQALEREARRLGVATVVLETGARQPEAVALYERSGYAPIPAFGEYIGSPLSVCLQKRL